MRRAYRPPWRGIKQTANGLGRYRLYKSNDPNTPNKPNKPQYDAVVLAVPHRVFREKEPEAFLTLLKDGDAPGVLMDVRGVLPREAVEIAGALYWSL